MNKNKIEPLSGKESRNELLEREQKYLEALYKIEKEYQEKRIALHRAITEVQDVLEEIPNEQYEAPVRFWMYSKVS
ncbi:MAG: hypothetical protein HXX08_06050 [Chloroflexi bacterium]|uniref:Uncharacterized protein n=1 Tax=Candidatus Chlorohelix allophototropha TaxID=3003348 RepID=A0A8T7M367_9CHLR|nr:hypothetical protein [Chloroflexota bacterium]WJW67298.1 hypothetical protein OZ401_000558 [Chloroflexota bacterium L227-S17]